MIEGLIEAVVMLLMCIFLFWSMSNSKRRMTRLFDAYEERKADEKKQEASL